MSAAMDSKGKKIAPEDVGIVQTSSWEDIKPLPELAPDPPDITPDMLPESLRPWIQDAARRASVHLAFISVTALCAAGAVIGRSVGIYPKQRDDWQEVPNLWGAVTAPPSSLKSYAVSEGTLHIRRLAAKATESFNEQQADNQLEAEMIKIDLAALKQKAKGKKANIDDFRAQIKEKMQELNDLENLKEKRYIVNDTTMEKAGMLLGDNPRGLLYLKDELVGLLRACDKPGNEQYRPFLLEAWNGKGSYTFDRVGRGTLHVPAVTLSLAGGIQPGKLRSYIAGAMKGEEGADGLLQRFQLFVWFDKSLPYERVDAYPDNKARDKAFEIFHFFDSLFESELVAENVGKESQFDAIPGVRFSLEAQERFNTWLDTHMHMLRSDALSPTPAFQAHLAKYPSLVASLALIFHLTELAEVNELEKIPPVTVSALELALRWTAYLEQHARKLYAAELETDAVSALALSERIEAGEVEDGCKLSDIYRKGWPHLTSKAEVEAAVKLLTEANRVQVKEIQNKGARASLHLFIHPDLKEAQH